MRAPSNAQIPVLFYGVAALTGVAAFATSNPVLTVASILTALLFIRLLWRAGEPPVLLFAAGYQLIQVVMLVFIADVKGTTVEGISRYPAIETSIWYGLFGVIALAIGMTIGVRKTGRFTQDEFDDQLRSLSVNRAFFAYLLLTVFSATLPYIVWRVLPIAQLLLAVGSLKWVFYILLGYLTLRRRTKILYFVLATLLEVLLGIGFFSGFKTVFFVCALVILSVHVRLNFKMFVATTVAATVITLAGIGWMSIREQYRNFLNQGTGQQVVLVSPTEQVAEFAGLVANIEPEDLHGSIEQMFRRIAYVDYFAAAIAYVPKQRPFENGTLLLRAIRHVLVPRFLNPDKDVLESDSDITMRYTGLSVAGSAQGTSIGMGYMAEGYVDFGVYGMVILAFCLGVLWGAMYKWLVNHSTVIAVGLAFGTALLIDASQFEIAETKLLGGMVSEFLVLAVILRYVMPGVTRWFTVRPRALIIDDAARRFDPAIISN